MYYNASLKAQRDEYVFRKMQVDATQKANAARQERFQEGFQKGFREGFQRGRVEMLKSILASGNFTPAKLAQRTGWDEAYILELIK